MSVAAAATMECRFMLFRSACFWEIELYDLRSVESGSVLTMYLITGAGPIWLQLRFDGGYVGVSALAAVSPADVVAGAGVLRCPARVPLTVTLRDGQLVVAVGSSSATLDDIKAFQGVFTTQGVSGRMKVYSWQESSKKRLSLA